MTPKFILRMVIALFAILTTGVAQEKGNIAVVIKVEPTPEDHLVYLEETPFQVILQLEVGNRREPIDPQNQLFYSTTADSFIARFDSVQLDKSYMLIAKLDRYCDPESLKLTQTELAMKSTFWVTLKPLLCDLSIEVTSINRSEFELYYSEAESFDSVAKENTYPLEKSIAGVKKFTLWRKKSGLFLLKKNKDEQKFKTFSCSRLQTKPHKKQVLKRQEPFERIVLQPFK